MKTRYAAYVLLSMCFAAAAAAQTYTVTDLGVLPGFTSSLAYDNNTSGQVTGCSDNSILPTTPCTTNIPADAYLWSSGSGMQDLGHLAGDDLSVGYVVNDSGAVVGFSGNTQTGVTHAFFWSQSGGMIDLGTLPGGNGYSVADAITSKGVIVGQSVISNGDVHAVLWTKSGGTYHIHDKGHLLHAPYTYPYDINEKLHVNIGTRRGYTALVHCREVVPAIQVLSATRRNTGAVQRGRWRQPRLHLDQEKQKDAGFEQHDSQELRLGSPPCGFN